MLSCADKAAEASKRQDTFFFILKVHWIIFTLTISNIFTSVTQSKILKFLLHKMQIVELNEPWDLPSKEALPLWCWTQKYVI